MAPRLTAEPSPYQLATDQAHAYLHREVGDYTPEVMRWMVEGLTVMRPADIDVLRCWLEGRERDIATGWEDLGFLRSVFEAVLGREPQEEGPG